MSRAAFSSRQATRTPARAVAVGAQAKGERAVQAASRREAFLGIAVATAAAFSTQPAEAFLGFGEDPSKVYTEDTSALLGQIKEVLNSDSDDKEGAVKSLKKDMNNWTAKYRTNSPMGGRPSFGNMYSAVNALAGHWNSFGADAPVPKKRMARITKELEDVEKLLARGR